MFKLKVWLINNKSKEMFMQKILMTMVLCISTIFAQIGQDEKWNEFEKFYKNFKETSKLNEKVNLRSTVDYKKMLKSYYDVIALSQAEFKNNFKRLHKEWITERKKGKKTLKPAILLRKMKEVLAEKYGESFVEIISSPYYLKVNVNNIEKDFYESDGRKYPKIKLDCEVLEVIKGKHKFKKSRNVIVNYIEWWLSESDLKFEEGKTYFIPVKQWGKDYEELGLYILQDNSFGVYPICNGFFEREMKFFELSNTKEWKQFKKNFIKNYVVN